MTPAKPDCKDLTALNPAHCLEQFRRLEERLADVQAGIAEIRTIYESQQRRLDRVEATLYGNGATGLCTKVSAILWLSSAIAGFVGVLLAESLSSAIGNWFKG